MLDEERILYTNSKQVIDKWLFTACLLYTSYLPINDLEAWEKELAKGDVCACRLPVITEQTQELQIGRAHV